MQNKQQDELAHNIRRQLDDAVVGMDGATQSKLRQARAQAMEKALASSRPFYRSIYRRQWLPAGVALTSVLALVVLLVPLQPERPDSGQAELLVAEDLEILSQPEELELYEDLEFYRWMSASGMDRPELG